MKIKFVKISERFCLHYKVYGYKKEPVDLFLGESRNGISLSAILEVIDCDLSKLEYAGIDIGREIAFLRQASKEERRQADVLLTSIDSVLQFNVFACTPPRKYSTEEFAQRGIRINAQVYERGT